MKTCRSCRQENPDKNLFCDACGKPLVETPLEGLPPPAPDDTYLVTRQSRHWKKNLGTLAFLVFFCTLGYALGTLTGLGRSSGLADLLPAPPDPVLAAAARFENSASQLQDQAALLLSGGFPRTPVPSQTAALVPTTTPTNTPFQPTTGASPEFALSEAVGGAQSPPNPAITAAQMYTNWLFSGGQAVGVKDFAFDHTIDHYVADPGKTYLSIYIIAMNVSDQPVQFNPLHFQLVDGQNAIHEHASFPVKSPPLALCTAQPGGRCEGWWTAVIDDQPQTKGGLTLRWQPPWAEIPMDAAIYDQPNAAGVIDHTIPVTGGAEGETRLTCESILLMREQNNPADWEVIKQNLAGQRITGWLSKVRSVEKHGQLTRWYTVDLEVTDGCALYGTLPDQQTAARYSKGQRVAVSGEVQSISEGIFGEITLILKTNTMSIQ